MKFNGPYIVEIAPKTYAINEYGLDAQYLLVGDERALLIDTGSGLLDLKAIVASITDKPYDVVLTHSHMDHCGGITQFDEVYIHPLDMEKAIEPSYEERVNYAKTLGEMGAFESYGYTLDDVKPDGKVPVCHLIEEGYVFELGNRPVEVLHVPGHTPGGICLMDDKTRIMFSGDCCNVNTLILGCSVNTLLKAVRKVIANRGRFDRNYNGHIGYAGLRNCMSQPESVPYDLEKICIDILKGEAKPEMVPFLNREVLKYSYNNAGASYDPDRLIDPDEIPEKY